MADRKIDNERQDGVWEALHEVFDTEVPQDLEKQLKESLDGFREDLRVHPYIAKQEWYGSSKWQRAMSLSRFVIRPLIYAGTGLACVAIALSFFFGKNVPTWAEVVEHFAVSPVCTGMVYARMEPFSKPIQIEYWTGRDNRLRILSGSIVTFAKKGEFIRAFDLETRSESQTDWATDTVLDVFGYRQWGLPGMEMVRSLLKDMYSGKILETTSLINASSEISKDLVVFDAKYPYYDAFLRVWALRESKLPIRINMWASNGWRNDVLLTYSKEQSKEFFDPDVFAAKLKDPSNSSVSLMYMGLKDAAGSSIPAPGN